MPGRAQAYTEAVTEANVHRFVRNLGGPEGDPAAAQFLQNVARDPLLPFAM